MDCSLSRLPFVSHDVLTVSSLFRHVACPVLILFILFCTIPLYLRQQKLLL